MTITTPALLFPAISLLLLAYTNRFVVLAQLIRQLHGNHKKNPQASIIPQIKNLKTRISLVKTMQAFGILSFLICTFSMFFLFTGQPAIGNAAFGTSIALLSLSLCIALWEVLISGGAIMYELNDLEKDFDPQ